MAAAAVPPPSMRPNWLRGVGYYKRRRELYEETHNLENYVVKIPSGSTVDFKLIVPNSIASAASPTASISEIVGINGLVWPSAVEEALLIKEAFFKRSVVIPGLGIEIGRLNVSRTFPACFQHHPLHPAQAADSPPLTH